MEVASVDYRYIPSNVVRFFHSWPHWDLSFNEVDKTFSPESNSYIQALLLLAAVSVLWMLLWVLVYMIYFCVLCLASKRCCTNQSKASRAKSQRAKWVAGVLLIFLMMGLSVALYGSEMVSFGVQSAHDDLQTVSSDIDSVKMQTAVLLHGVDSLSNSTGRFLSEAFVTAPNLDDIKRPLLRTAATQFISKLTTISAVIRSQIQLKFTPLTEVTTHYSFVTDHDIYRRLGTGCLIALLQIFLIISLCSVAGCKKRNCLLICVMLCVVNVLLLWCAAAVYTMGTVGLADFCMDPSGYINSTQAQEGSAMWTYYSNCVNSPEANPFNRASITLQDQFSEAAGFLKIMEENADPQSAYILQRIQEGMKSIESLRESQLRLSSSTGCLDIYRSYYSAVESVCQTSMIGMVCVFGSLVASGLVAIVIVFVYHCASRVPAKRSYVEVNTHDPTGCSTAPSSRSDNPLYYRFSQISTNETDNLMDGNIITRPTPSAPPARSSPPPAYKNHNEFYSTYGNSSSAGVDNSNTVSNDLNRNSNTFRNV